MVFNLDSSVSNDELHEIFGVYGEIREVMGSFNYILLAYVKNRIKFIDVYFCLQIRETPHKRNHKFIEFFDVRAAEAALRALNRSDIAGKQIKLEPSRPGGARRYGVCLFQLFYFLFSLVR